MAVKTRVLSVAILAALVMAFAGFVSACGGGDSQLTPLEEYFAELEQLLDDFGDLGDEMQGAFDEALEDADDEYEEADAIQDFLSETASFLASLRDDLSDLNAPNDVEDEHQNLVDGATGSAESLENLADDLADADDESDFNSLLRDADLIDTDFGFDAACIALQEFADDEDIDVDLGCEDDESGDDAPETDLGFPPEFVDEFLDDFLAVVAEAEDAGVVPHWLGEGFQAGGLTYRLQPSASIVHPTGSAPSLRLEYSAATVAGGFVAVVLRSFSKEEGGAAGVEQATSQLSGSPPRETRVSGWPARLYSLSTPTRPVNKLELYVEIDDFVVLVRAGAVSSGIPGDDRSPLIDAELLLETVGQNLRPFPE